MNTLLLIPTPETTRSLALAMGCTHPTTRTRATPLPAARTLRIDRVCEGCETTVQTEFANQEDA